jgi:cellulose synthase/poly-beta-1,6-N-acetylglucosamine synthase-like glycosyltransferase
VRSGGAARRPPERGLAATTSEWVAFLDDDVLPPPGWYADLLADLADADAPGVAGSAGRIVVPAPESRPPTDWERNVAGLQTAQWATADMAYRRYALEIVGGFDERFPRAFREDADLAARVRAAGFRLVHGRRHVVHPVRPADRWVSVRLQAGNADDALMRAVHGRAWRSVAGVPAGRRAWHLATSSSLATALAGLVSGRRRVATAAALAPAL